MQLKNLLVISFSLLVSTLSAQGIDFFHGSYEDALVKAEDEGKLIFVDAYAVWCGPCKRMSNQVFPREDVGTFFNENFVSLKIDMEKGPGRKFGKEFPVSSYPTLFFINNNGELVQRVIGAQAPDKLIQQAKLAIRKTDNSAGYAKRYNEGERDPEMVLKYLKSLKKAGKPTLAIANEYLRGVEQVNTADNLAILFEGTEQADSRIFDLFVENKAELKKQFGETVVNDKIRAACLQTMQNALTFKSDRLMTEAKEKMAEHLPEETDAFEAKADFAKAKNTKDSGLAFTSAKKVVQANGNTAAANHAMAVELYKYFESQPKAMTLAAKLAGQAAKKESNFDHLFTYAQLLFKSGKGKKAEKQAEKAMKLLGNQDDPRRAAMLNDLIDQLQG